METGSFWWLWLWGQSWGGTSATGGNWHFGLTDESCQSWAFCWCPMAPDISCEKAKKKVKILELKPARIQQKVSFLLLSVSLKADFSPYFLKWHKPNRIHFVVVFVFSGNTLGQIILWAIAMFRFNYIIRVNACKSDKWDIISYRILWQTYTVHMKYMVLKLN